MILVHTQPEAAWTLLYSLPPSQLPVFLLGLLMESVGEDAPGFADMQAHYMDLLEAVHDYRPSMNNGDRDVFPMRELMQTAQSDPEGTLKTLASFLGDEETEWQIASVLRNVGEARPDLAIQFVLENG